NWPIQPARRIGFRRVARATERRTMTATVLAPCPAANTVPVLTFGTHHLAASAILNSLVFDWELRRRVTAADLTWFVLQGCSFPQPNNLIAHYLDVLAARLTCLGPHYSVDLARIGRRSSSQRLGLMPSLRLQMLVQIDVLVAALYCLS